MGRPPSIIEDYREWQRRLERYQTHEVNLDVFCLQEGVSRSTFFRWKRRTKAIRAALVEPIAAHAPTECRSGGQRPWIELTLTNSGTVVPTGCRGDIPSRMARGEDHLRMIFVPARSLPLNSR